MFRMRGAGPAPGCRTTGCRAAGWHSVRLDLQEIPVRVAQVRRSQPPTRQIPGRCHQDRAMPLAQCDRRINRRSVRDRHHEGRTALIRNRRNLADERIPLDHGERGRPLRRVPTGLPGYRVTVREHRSRQLGEYGRVEGEDGGIVPGEYARIQSKHEYQPNSQVLSTGPDPSIYCSSNPVSSTGAPMLHVADCPVLSAAEAMTVANGPRRPSLCGHQDGRWFLGWRDDGHGATVEGPRLTMRPALSTGLEVRADDVRNRYRYPHDVRIVRDETIAAPRRHVQDRRRRQSRRMRCPSGCRVDRGRPGAAWRARPPQRPQRWS